jgi:hypothetical protein
MARGRDRRPEPCRLTTCWRVPALPAAIGRSRSCQALHEAEDRPGDEGILLLIAIAALVTVFVWLVRHQAGPMPTPRLSAANATAVTPMSGRPLAAIRAALRCVVPSGHYARLGTRGLLLRAKGMRIQANREPLRR